MNPSTSLESSAPEPRKGMPSPRLKEAEFKSRFLAQYQDQVFAPLKGELASVAEAAWTAYDNHRKSPKTRKAGPGYADPDYDLAIDWLDTKAAVEAAQTQYDLKDRKGHILLVNASSRSEHTCPGEMSKSYRMIELAEEVMVASGIENEILDLSRTTSEYGRNIHPCKACFSTAAPLCHWPCSCYPNYSLGQTQDWMNDICPMWVKADGGNPDPTLTHGKTARLAKKVELDRWHYPRHLEGRLFSVIVHGDVEGTKAVRQSVSEWLKFMRLHPAGALAEVDRYMGYWKPYADNHLELDADLAMQGEVRNAAKTIVEAVLAKRSGTLIQPGQDLHEPRQK